MSDKKQPKYFWLNFTEKQQIKQFMIGKEEQNHTCCIFCFSIIFMSNKFVQTVHKGIIRPSNKNSKISNCIHL